MIKKITTAFAVIAFASSTSIALACTTDCSGKDSKGDTGLSNTHLFEVAKSGCGGSCGDKKDNP